MRNNRFQELFSKYREGFLYLFFGAVTTVVNIVVFHVANSMLKISTVPSTVIAWILAVAVAYITNKIWVFNSHSFKKEILLPEIRNFLSCRVATGLFDLAVMYICVDLLRGNADLWKVLSNIIVIILNYVGSKILVFKSK